VPLEGSCASTMMSRLLPGSRPNAPGNRHAGRFPPEARRPAAERWRRATVATAGTLVCLILNKAPAAGQAPVLPAWPVKQSGRQPGWRATAAAMHLPSAKSQGISPCAGGSCRSGACSPAVCRGQLPNSSGNR
jgi:hypothetical protein